MKMNGIFWPRAHFKHGLNECMPIGQNKKLPSVPNTVVLVRICWI